MWDFFFFDLRIILNKFTKFIFENYKICLKKNSCIKKKFKPTFVSKNWKQTEWNNEYKVGKQIEKHSENIAKPSWTFRKMQFDRINICATLSENIGLFCSMSINCVFTQLLNTLIVLCKYTDETIENALFTFNTSKE